MNTSSRSLRAFAAGGSFLAGYVDAIGFLETHGYFVSFMSGNSTRLAVGIVEAQGVALPAVLIACFVLGVVGGSIVGRRAGERQTSVVFATLACVLAVSAALRGLGFGVGTMLLVAVAMGMENSAIEANGEVRIGLTYMTGTLVKLGQNLASAMQGGPRWGWVRYLLLWLGMIVGAIVGAACHPLIGAGSLWLAAAFAVTLAWVASSRKARLFK